MPPRSFPAVTPDSRILEQFTTSRTQLKAHRVLVLLGLPRSKIRNIQSALQRLARHGALIELPSASPAHPHPPYARPAPPGILSHASSCADAVGNIQTTPAEEPSTCATTTLAASADGTGRDAVAIVQLKPAMLPTEDSVAEEDIKPQQPVCAVCRESWPTEVLLPCRHQACCKTCWSGCVIRERVIHNRNERLKRELGARGQVRSAFLPRCPICMVAVNEVISPYTNP